MNDTRLIQTQHLIVNAIENVDEVCDEGGIGMHDMISLARADKLMRAALQAVKEAAANTPVVGPDAPPRKRGE